MKPFLFMLFLLLRWVESHSLTQCHKLKLAHLHVHKGASSRDLEICDNASNVCCSRQTEQEMYEKAENAFRLQLQDKVIILRHLIHTNLNSFRTYFYNSLNTCHTQLDDMFRRTYGPFYESNARVFDSFFNQLRAFSSPYSDTNVQQTTDRMFADLFKVVFSLLNPLTTVTVEQAKCMEEGMSDISPFGDMPKKIVVHLEKVMTLWRHFVASLEAANDVLHGFMNVTLSKQCVQNLVRMNDCSMCGAQPVTVKPCANYCSNVMKGCLAEWSEMDQQWNSVIVGLQKLSQQLGNTHNLHNTLAPLPVQISEAVMIFQERGATVTNKVLARCFHMDQPSNDMKNYVLVRGKRAIWPRSLQETHTIKTKVLQQLMLSFSDRLNSAKGWFNDLPSTFCTDSGLAAKENDKCWNGHDVSSYSQPLVADGIGPQASNPEYQQQRRLQYPGQFVQERLKLGVLSFRLQNAVHGRNYSNYELMEEGSSLSSDDEDYQEASGDVMTDVVTDMGRHEPISSFSSFLSLIVSTLLILVLSC